MRISIEDRGGGVIQELTFQPEINQIHFSYGGAPVYGLGPGSHPLDRRGTKDMMRNGAGDNLRVLGARNPIPWLMGNGWGLYFHEPGGTFDLTGDSGIFHPSDVARGQDLFLVTADTPTELLRQYAEITGYPHLSAKWTLGYQQSHRTLDSREQIIEEAKTFREKRLPCDTMIYLGTGFCPSGWNTGHGSFVFNEKLFSDPEQIIRELHDLHFNVVLHVVNPPENLHGEVSDTGLPSYPETQQITGHSMCPWSRWGSMDGGPTKEMYCLRRHAWYAIGCTGKERGGRGRTVGPLHCIVTAMRASNAGDGCGRTIPFRHGRRSKLRS